MIEFSLTLLFGISIGVAWNKFNVHLYGHFLSPFNILFFVWVLPFIIQLSSISNLQQGISLLPMTILVVSTLVMVLTLVVFQTRYPRIGIENGLGETKKLPPSAISFNKLFWLSLVLIILSLSAKVQVEFSDGIPLVMYLDSQANSAVLHRFGKDSKLQILAQSLSIGGMLSWYYWLQASGQKKFKLFSLLLALVPIIVGVLKASKSDIFEPLFLYAVIYYFVRADVRRISYGRFATILLASLFLLWSITEVRLEGQGVLNTYAEIIDFKDGIPPIMRDFLAMPYGYIFMNFENFGQYVDMADFRFRIGTSMFRPIFSVLMQGGIPNELLHDLELYELTPAANVGTFQRDLYVEGGAIICFLGAFWNALLIRLAYDLFRKRADDFSMMIYATFLLPWSLLFFTNMFSVLTTFTNCFLVALIMFLSRCDKRIPSAN